jgi:hypothetical protein
MTKIVCVWRGGSKRMSLTQNSTRIKMISGAYTESDRTDFLYRNVTPETIKSKAEETS